MTARILDGKAIAKRIQAELADETAAFTDQSQVTPCLAAVLVGEDPASEVYVRNKRRACERVGMTSQLHRMSADTEQTELLAQVRRLNEDPAVHGILVQLPLPKSLDEQQILDAIHPLKDVDAFHPENVGLMSQGRPRYLPCTPHGVQQILYRSEIPTAGKRVAIVGRSEIVGKPMASMLVQRDSLYGPQYANATVTICHSRTEQLGAITSQADIVIAAIGKANFVTAEMVRAGATVVDVGINRTQDGLTGDVDFESVRAKAGAITPVPGGVGPLTVTMLLVNTLSAARLLSKRTADG